MKSLFKFIYVCLLLALVCVGVLAVLPWILPAAAQDGGDGSVFPGTLSLYSLFTGGAEEDGGAGQDGEEADGVPVLINAWNPYVFPDDPTAGMVNIFDSSDGACSVRNTDMLIAGEAMQPLNDMMSAFRSATGLDTVYISSAYRTYGEQLALWEEDGRNYSGDGPVAVAEPGNSEHHAGLAVDLGLIYSDGSTAAFDGTGDYSWFRENAHRYGFILRYTADKSDITGIIDEPWHFRYVGAEHAEQMYIYGLCLEEYVGLLREAEAGGEAA